MAKTHLHMTKSPHLHNMPCAVHKLGIWYQPSCRWSLCMQTSYGLIMEYSQPVAFLCMQIKSLLMLAFCWFCTWYCGFIARSCQCWGNMRHRLRPRSYLAFVCSLVFIIVCVYMYVILESASLTGGDGSSPVDQVALLLYLIPNCLLIVCFVL